LKISFTIEAMAGVNWPVWKHIVSLADSLGIAALYRSDHFSLGEPPQTDALELITSLTYLADHTTQVDFGSLVAPVSVREPVMLARQAMSLNDLSGGRMILGVGAGWMESEHTQFGYSLGGTKTRLDRLEEALHVIASLTRESDPVSFQGSFFQLQNARLLPRPEARTRILIGGNGIKRTLPLVARYADIWNCQVASLETFRELSALLDDLISKEGRDPGSVKRTVMIPVICYHSQQELHQILDDIRVAFAPGASDEDLMGMLASMNGIIAGPEEVIRKLYTYADAGAEEFIVQWATPKNVDRLEQFAREIMHAF
jgi:alkanesulfonate monooxygenase SsuD/methylene tetrahydromethanopterin reductase-like flavin-dependent oxidoreductase (luciferase family)